MHTTPDNKHTALPSRSQAFIYKFLKHTGSASVLAYSVFARRLQHHYNSIKTRLFTKSIRW